MEYMEQTRALLKYELPLNEIIYDFFDQLKSRTKGYASFDYEVSGYQKSDQKAEISIKTSKTKSVLLAFDSLPKSIRVKTLLGHICQSIDHHRTVCSVCYTKPFGCGI